MKTIPAKTQKEIEEFIQAQFDQVERICVKKSTELPTTWKRNKTYTCELKELWNGQNVFCNYEFHSEIVIRGYKVRFTIQPSSTCSFAVIPNNKEVRFTKEQACVFLPRSSWQRWNMDCGMEYELLGKTCTAVAWNGSLH